MHRDDRESVQTGTPFPDVCVHELFEAQVARTPHRTALIYQDRRLTYGELNYRANQLARALRDRGVGPDDLVGVSVERCFENIIGLLGVWKAGAAYVPLDPTYPRERLAFMVKDAGVRILLTSRNTRGQFEDLGDRLMCMDETGPALARESGDNLPAISTPSHLAYVMYTSGSTGTPKGAMIVQRGLVNYLWWAISAYGLHAGGAVPVHSSMSFDLTVTSLYPALLTGGAVELLPEDVGAESLIAALRATHDRALVKITPAHLELLSQQLTPDEARGMTRAFVIGGENLTAESLRFWREHAPATRLINEYGPTETVVGCCVYEVAPGDPDQGSVPIGRAIANTGLYLLDEQLQPVGPGVTGELYIGGAGVARGYLNRPELTAERFVADPFSGVSGARMYKTGDLARTREDGTFEYLGRTDHQVKIRGYRIELGEIEAALVTHEHVQSSAVLAREDAPGHKHLVGYVVLKKGATLAVEALQQFLRAHLPDHMVPPHIVTLETMPLTANGKVDRKALPAPVHKAADTAGFRTDTERMVAELWRELLQVGAVGPGDSFFELGGHSLLAMKAVARVRDVFGVSLQLRSLFEAPTVRGLAGVIDGMKWLDVTPSTDESGDREIVQL